MDNKPKELKTLKFEWKKEELVKSLRDFLIKKINFPTFIYTLI